MKETPEQTDTVPSGCPFTGFGSSKYHPMNRKFMKLKNYQNGQEFVDTLCNQAHEDTPCQPKHCGGSVMFPRSPEHQDRPRGTPRSQEVLLQEAKEFIDGYYRSMNRPPSGFHQARWEQIQAEVAKTGTYQLTTQELTYGAKMAWRNAYRCIGRIQWNKLTLFDARSVTTAGQMFDAICNHIKYTTNKGNLRSAITVFPQRTDGKHDYRVWNMQLVSYAGYRNEDGTITGDPANVEFTEVCQKLGWKSPKGRFDILPIVVSAGGQDPEFFDIPEDVILRIHISHPKYPWFKDMGLQWYALPAVSGMMFDCGGIEFCACPFSGWYMSTEVAARDLCDPQRYNMLEPIAKNMGLDTSNYRNLWKDQALVEANLAVLHSYQEANVTIVDHHTAADSFMKFMENEQRLRGGCPADWVWIVPPMSGSVTPVFHQEMSRYIVKPTYSYQVQAWKTHNWKKRDGSEAVRKQQRKFHFKEIAGAVQFASQLFGEALSRRVKATILYATETGKSETYANMLGQVFSHAFNAQVMCMDDYDIVDLEHEGLLLVVTSTFGNGDAPENGEIFFKALQNMAEEYHLMMSSTNTLDSVPDIKKPFNPAQRIVPVGQFARSQSTPKGMSVTEPLSKAVQNMSVPNTPDRTGQNGDWQRWPSVYSEAPAGSLANVRFAVFALGSSAYPKYCQFGKDVDSLLGHLSGERIEPVACGDELNGQEQSFKEWAADVFKAACDAFCLESDSVMARATERLNSDKAASPDAVRLMQTHTADDLVPGLGRCHGRQLISCTAKHARMVHEKDTGRSTINVSVTSGGNPSKLKFKPGDHLAVFPRNRQEIVNAIRRRLIRCPEGPVELQVMRKVTTPLGVDKRWEAHQRLPRTTVTDMLTWYMDVTTPPTPNMLRMMAAMATDENEQTKLKLLATNGEAYEEWKFTNWPNLAETLAEFPSIEADGPFILCNLPLMQARAYSISSAPDYRPDEVQLTVAVVQYHTRGGQGPLHYGVCSNYLNEIEEGDRIICYFRNAPSFHMPENKSDPIMMIGPGTGVAPFRSFWEQRHHEKRRAPEGTKFGPMTLFFGGRSRAMDLYAEEKKDMMQDGVLTKCHLALSRQPGVPKTYVQDQLMEQHEDVLECLTNPNGHIYVCGDCTMAHDVYLTLEKMLYTKAGMEPEQAKLYMEKMRDSNHYHEDIFGITLRTAEVTDKTRALISKKASMDKDTGADRLPKYRRDSIGVL
ncbi:nitric oxide synthase-like protein [Amphibalanus amphitrite]|uniref:nitric oxide synthase-like protein n=1 Tax=Amphibalanus amphitrite TaxID=1232801 RepID=UPI001C90362A|nr:nitric oxide synthase-like protein [Amphibalanus amphitrite]